MSATSPCVAFHSNGSPYLTSACPSGSIPTTLSNYRSTYLSYRQQWVEKNKQENQQLKIKSYNSYHSLSAYGQTNMSKRLIGRMAPQIYEFGKTVYN